MTGGATLGFAWQLFGAEVPEDSDVILNDSGRKASMQPLVPNPLASGYAPSHPIALHAPIQRISLHRCIICEAKSVFFLSSDIGADRTYEQQSNWADHVQIDECSERLVEASSQHDGLERLLR